MNILVIGSGGREHALCWKIAESPLLNKLFCLPGNAGTAKIARNIALSPLDFPAVKDFCRDNAVELVVVGPEEPLTHGITDYLQEHGVQVFGCSKAASMLEASKAYTKALCLEANIPTAEYAEFEALEPAAAYIRSKTPPLVIKADGLAAGKGVVIAYTIDEALQAAEETLSGRFGMAGNKILVEEFLQGEELSLFAVCDGRRALYLGSARDHKRAFDGDEGPNTGGMGTFSPVAAATNELVEEVMNTIITPTVETMASRGTPYQGVLFAGLMLTSTGPKLLEYNCRFGDPETQVLMRRYKGDIVPLLLGIASGNLSDIQIESQPGAAICVVMAAHGYPGEYVKNSVINGLDAAENIDGVQIFHAGTKLEGNKTIATGGRVLGITVLASGFIAARAKAYESIERINWPQGFCRKDIGKNA